MAETESAESPEEKPKAAPGGMSNTVKVLIGISLVFVLLAVVFFATYYFTKMWQTGGAPIPPSDRYGDPRDLGEQKPAQYREIGQFTVVIFDESGRSFNLRVTVLLTVNDERPEDEKAEVLQEIEARKPQLTDAIYDVLIGMDPKNFMGTSTERSEGMAELKASIIRAVNSRMLQKVDGCWLTEFIFQ
jgi:flagellar basal body-associated protein FliL